MEPSELPALATVQYPPRSHRTFSLRRLPDLSGARTGAGVVKQSGGRGETAAPLDRVPGARLEARSRAGGTRSEQKAGASAPIPTSHPPEGSAPQSLGRTPKWLTPPQQRQAPSPEPWHRAEGGEGCRSPSQRAFWSGFLFFATIQY